MTPSRRTQLGERASDMTWTRAVAFLVLPVALFGCGAVPPPGPDPSPHAVGANDPAWITNRPNLPPPDTDRINYDKDTRTLSLYDLPGNDRWVVQLPGEEVGRPVAAHHRIPDVDPSEVFVYYTRPGAPPSAPVSVKQIQDSGSVHVSLANR